MKSSFYVLHASSDNAALLICSSTHASIDSLEDENHCTIGGRALATPVPDDSSESDSLSTCVSANVKDTSTLHVLKHKACLSQDTLSVEAVD